MNPYTRSLLKELEDPDLHAWVEAWDELESLVVEVYRAQAAGPDDDRDYQRLREALRRDYESWRPALERHWDGLKAGGEELDRDPFWALLEPEQVAEFVENWQAMQTLPAAREALNNYLIDRIEAG